ncbi:MAG: GIY-YIG nuclease family protein [bacterium]|nr:GIY-YIG nuclease family protein [bacterium]
MYYVYILINSRCRKYIGFSEDLKTRLRAHQSKSVKTTKNADDMQLTFYAAFKTKTKALAFEKYLKQGSGFAFANKHLV